MSRFSRISRVEVTGSTNEDIARILGEEHARGLTLVANYQERGSGRKGRSWVAAPGSALLCTIALPDALPTADLWVLPFWTALVVVNALHEFGVSAIVQWPNDLLLKNRKVAGILCVSRVIGEYAWAACGIGLNVHRPADAALADITPPPAFVSDVAQIDRERVLQEVLRQADAAYDDLATPQFIMQAWEQAAGIPGVRYRVSIDGESEPFDAMALRLLTGGTLLVEYDGKQREITLADTRILR